MKKIIFFDSSCSFCNKTVTAIIKLDKKFLFFFAPLNGTTIEKIPLIDKSIKDKLHSLVYVNEKTFIQSDAVLAIAYDFFDSLFYFKFLKYVVLLFKLCPKKIRDYMYMYIAKNRYKIFKKQMLCDVFSKEDKKRFLP